MDKSSYLFLCSNETQNECFLRKLFGRSSMVLSIVKEIREGNSLFLYNYDWDFLFGIFEADGKGKRSIDEYAWNGRFPAQVKVRWDELHRLVKASKTFSFLTNKYLIKLSPEQTHQLTTSLKDAPIYSPIIK